MNCTELFVTQARNHPTRTALWTPKHGETSFAELESLAAKAQKLLRREGLRPGDSVLLIDFLGPRLYAAISGILALGGTVVLVEPWMAVEKVRRVVDSVKPKFFVSNWFGRFWGLRVASVRKIPHWVSISAVEKESGTAKMHVESVDGQTPGILTFTSGTTGNPKGVVRHQCYLVQQHEVLAKSLHLSQFSGPDLCIFANFALSNLASGRGSVLVPGKWPAKALEALNHFPAHLKPDTLTCGPAFLLRMMELKAGRALKAIHVGGALTDCAIFERGFELWPDADWSHIYGSSEAEPVAVSDARAAVRDSRRDGWFQTLALGAPVAAVDSELSENGLWVTGPHVCPRYLGNEEENRVNKRQGPDGRIWHFMGDRVKQSDGQWWYSGRSHQAPEDFELEQKIYATLKSSASFVHRTKSGERHLIGKKVADRADEIQSAFPEISSVVETKIFRDPRHRARLDRARTLKKGAKWLAG